MKVNLSQVLKPKNFREELDHLKQLRQAYAYAHAGETDPYSSLLASKSDCWRTPDLYAHLVEGISPFSDLGSYSASEYHV